MKPTRGTRARRTPPSLPAVESRALRVDVRGGHELNALYAQAYGVLYGDDSENQHDVNSLLRALGQE